MALGQHEPLGDAGPREAQLVAEAVAEHLGPQTEWAEWPGGYGNRADLALVDAVMSIRLSYGREPEDGGYTGVRGAVWRYRVATATLEGGWLESLATRDPADLGAILRNRNRLRGGKTKAEAIVEAAGNLVRAGLSTRTLILTAVPRARSAYTSVTGLGPVTFEYFTMLLGADGVKEDTWVIRFASSAVGRPLGPQQAGAAVKGAARILGCDQATLDHAIWSFATTTQLAAMAPWGMAWPTAPGAHP